MSLNLKNHQNTPQIKNPVRQTSTIMNKLINRPWIMGINFSSMKTLTKLMKTATTNICKLEGFLLFKLAQKCPVLQKKHFWRAILNKAYLNT